MQSQPGFGPLAYHADALPTELQRPPGKRTATSHIQRDITNTLSAPDFSSSDEHHNLASP